MKTFKRTVVDPLVFLGWTLVIVVVTLPFRVVEVLRGRA